MEKTVTLNGKEYSVKEISYVQGLELIDLPKIEQAKKLLTLSCGLTNEEANSLTFKEGLILQKAVNEVNDLGNFQNPVEEIN